MNNYNYPNDMYYQDPYVNQNMYYTEQTRNMSNIEPTRDMYYEISNETKLPQNYDVMKGFLRGNLFDSLYEPYRNYNPVEPIVKNEKEALLQKVQAYMFAVTELNLYLDNNPNDREAIRLFNEYQEMEKELCHQYVSKYGPMTVYSESTNSMPWSWNMTTWPWEVNNV